MLVTLQTTEGKKKRKDCVGYCTNKRRKKEKLRSVAIPLQMREEKNILMFSFNLQRREE